MNDFASYTFYSLENLKYFLKPDSFYVFYKTCFILCYCLSSVLDFYAVVTEFLLY